MTDKIDHITPQSFSQFGFFLTVPKDCIEPSVIVLCNILHECVLECDDISLLFGPFDKLFHKCIQLLLSGPKGSPYIRGFQRSPIAHKLDVVLFDSEALDNIIVDHCMLQVKVANSELMIHDQSVHYFQFIVLLCSVHYAWGVFNATAFKTIRSHCDDYNGAWAEQILVL